MMKMTSSLVLVLCIGPAMLGCNRAPSCKDAVTAALGRVQVQGAAGIIGACEVEGWSAETRKCVASATSLEALSSCGMLRGPEHKTRQEAVFGESRIDVARMAVNKYANEAYPSWATSHNDGCPKSLADLNEYMNNRDTKDPWGNDYRMFCGADLPAGANGLGVMSYGEDGREGTSDDIKSW